MFTVATYGFTRIPCRRARRWGMNGHNKPLVTVFGADPSQFLGALVGARRGHGAVSLLCCDLTDSDSILHAR